MEHTHTLLIVDDDVSTRQLLEVLLHPHYQAVSTADALAALQWMSLRQFTAPHLVGCALAGFYQPRLSQTPPLQRFLPIHSRFAVG